MSLKESPLPTTLRCWSCSGRASLQEEKFQGYILDESGEEHDAPTTFGIYVCVCGETTQAVFDHRRNLLHVQENDLRMF